MPSSVSSSEGSLTPRNRHSCDANDFPSTLSPVGEHDSAIDVQNQKSPLLSPVSGEHTPRLSQSSSFRIYERERERERERRQNGSFSIPPTSHSPPPTLASSIYHLLQRPVCRFITAQIIIIWFVATAVIYIQDYALRMKPGTVSGGGEIIGSKAGGALGQLSMLEHLRNQFRDKCPLTPPVCKMVTDGDGIGSSNFYELKEKNEGRKKENLPLVFFLAGVEGSGHKFFEQVLRNIPNINFTVTQYEPLLHLTAEDTQTHVHGADVRCPLLPYARPFRELAKEMAARLAAIKSGPYLRARDSYPLGRVRTPLARPDLISLAQLSGLLFDLKIIVLQRGLSDAIRSAYRMGYHGNDIGLQVRIVEDEMTFLDATIRTMPCGMYLVLDFDWIADDPKLMAEPLAKFLGMGVTKEDVVSSIHKAMRSKPSHNATYPTFGNQKLEEFFALRSDMWPMLAACRAAPYFWPQNQRDWPVENENAALVAERRMGADYD